MNLGLKVFVIMGIYNCECILVESIEFIFSQFYKNWELIMCDDVLIDGMFCIVKQYVVYYSDCIKLI